MKRLLVLVVVAANLYLTAPGAGASGAPLGRIVARVEELNATGASRAVVERVLRTEFGLRLLAHAPITPAQEDGPGSNDVVLETPMLTSREVGDELIMIGRMRWNDCGNRRCWHKDTGTDGGSHGGPDGLGIQINRSISRVNAYMSLTSNCGDYVQFRQPAADNEFGVGFKEQDREGSSRKCRRGTGYNWDSATIGEEFHFNDDRGYCNGGRRYQVQTRFTHTWNVTSLTGISISIDGIGFSWANEGHHFEALPHEPLIVRC